MRRYLARDCLKLDLKNGFPYHCQMKRFSINAKNYRFRKLFFVTMSSLLVLAIVLIEQKSNINENKAQEPPIVVEAKNLETEETQKLTKEPSEVPAPASAAAPKSVVAAPLAKSKPAAKSSSASPSSTSQPTAKPVDGNTVEIIRLINIERQKAGLSVVKVNQTLDDVSYAKAKDMFENKYFAHTSTTGVSDISFINQSSYKYIAVGINLAKGSFNNQSLVDAWMDSAGHKANILASYGQDIGIGICDQYYVMFIAQGTN